MGKGTKWILFLPIYWLISLIVLLTTNILLKWISSFDSILYWLAVPQILLFGAVVSPIATIILLIDKFNLPLKPASAVLLLNNLLVCAWTISSTGLNHFNEFNVFVVTFGCVSLMCIGVLFFVNDPKSAAS